MPTTSSVSRLAGLIGTLLVALVVTSTIPAPVSATVCIVPDNGGTADMPPNCSSGYLSPSDVHMIIDGLPPGTTIEVDASHSDFFNVARMPGGNLGGEVENFQSFLGLTLTGTGTLTGFNRVISIGGVQDQTHIAPRTPGDPVQSFDTEMFALQGQITNPGAGDPDFDLLRVTAGGAFGMPSPGHTTLARTAGGGWNVDSFFDITYRIDFVGAPGGQLAGMSGSTTGTIRMQVGEPAQFDHLECFKPKDPLKFQATVDLPAVDGGLYHAAGCVVKGKAKKYCTPVMKNVVASDVPVTPMPGQILTNDFLCYKMKCPKVELSQNVIDQFGTRVVTKLKQKELCVPAQKVP